ncbi:hypothetical protein ABVT39_018432 [Epinephelus coioides]
MMDYGFEFTKTSVIVISNRVLHTAEFYEKRYFRLDKSEFDDVLTKVGPRIQRMDANYRYGLSQLRRSWYAVTLLKIDLHLGPMGQQT